MRVLGGDWLPAKMEGIWSLSVGGGEADMEALRRWRSGEFGFHMVAGQRLSVNERE